MSAEDLLREMLAERFPQDRSERPHTRRRRLTDEQKASLLGATAAVLAAMRALVAVGEQVVRDRQAALIDQGNEAPMPTEDDRRERTRTDLQF